MGGGAEGNAHGNGMPDSQQPADTGACNIAEGTGNYPGVAGAEIIDDYTIKIVMTAPDSVFMDKQWTGDCCVVKDGTDEELAQTPIGTGPFKVETVKLGEYTTLVRNAEYYKTGTGNIEKIYMYPSTDAGDTNLITNAQAGNIDYAFCKDSAQAQQLMAMDGYNVETVNVTFPRYIFVNMFERPAK